MNCLGLDLRDTSAVTSTFTHLPSLLPPGGITIRRVCWCVRLFVRVLETVGDIKARFQWTTQTAYGESIDHVIDNVT